MTAAIALEKGGPDRSEQLEQLRRQMAAVSGKVGARSPAAMWPLWDCRTSDCWPPRRWAQISLGWR